MAGYMGQSAQQLPPGAEHAVEQAGRELGDTQVPFGGLLVGPLYGWLTGVFALLLYLYRASFISAARRRGEPRDRGPL